MHSLDEAVKEFLVESHENLDQLDRDFVALESAPDATQRIAGIFRTIHTIKGNSGFLGYSNLEALTHAGEHLLSALRDDAISFSSAIATVLLAMVDRIRAALKSIEESGKETSTPHDDLILALNAARASAEAARKQGVDTLPAPVASPAPTPSVPPAVPAPVLEVAKVPAAAIPQPVVPATSPSPAGPPVGAASKEDGASLVAETNVRVDVSLLDKLMNLVGELVLSRNQILQFGARIEDIAGPAQRLNLITTELQEQVMKTRMQPIGNVWSKLPRVVRDLAMLCGKQVRIEMVGKTTDLDRTILEAIKDPLTHIVRNAVDHGIESPDARAALGKPKTGTLTLRAYHEGGQVNIEISDDGAGVNPEVIRRKAIQRSVVSAERAARMTDEELVQLVFVAGFSTAEKVSNVSGRGVGMDVVKTNIERIGGTVDLRGSPGKGATIHIKIPLTLAIVPALIVTTGTERYAIPQASLLELVRLEGVHVKAIERIHQTPVYRLRGRLLPIVFLNEALNPGGNHGAENRRANPVTIVVLQADGRQFGLVVDDVQDTEEIVVKPLGRELKGISVFAGATIMGDGKVALILDVLGLAQHAGAVGATRERVASDRAQHGGTGEEPQALLLFDVSGGREMAVPLAMIARLEEFSRSRLERVGKRTVVQYRERILPLVELAETLGEREVRKDEQLQVIVYSEGGKSVGFVVGRILDVVEEAICVDPSGAQHGVLGATVLQGRVVELLDVSGLVRSLGFAPLEGRAA